MITVFLRGGLGNQMFQYATGLSLAKKNKTQMVIDSTFLNDRFPRKEFTYREYDLDVFTIYPSFTALSVVSKTVPIPGAWLGIDVVSMEARNLLGVQKIIREKDENIFDPTVPRATGNILLYGRWQNEKYFSDHEDDVRKAFTFRAPLDEASVRLREAILSCNAVSVCVRRGDYVNFASVKNEMGDAADNGYYSRAIGYINERVREAKYFIFSDDTAWCKEHLQLPMGAVFVDLRGPKWSFHLELMSLCKHHIIPNSTFYWWGAWLSRNPQKIVVAPKHWYADPSKGRDIVPRTWGRV